MEPQPSVPVYNLLLSGDGREACHSVIKINGDRKSLIPSAAAAQRPGEQLTLIFNCFDFHFEFIWVCLFVLYPAPPRHPLYIEKVESPNVTWKFLLNFSPLCTFF